MASKQTKLRVTPLTTGLMCISLLLPCFAQAIEFQSVAVNKAILYDAPALDASKRVVLGQGYPVEVLVKNGAWLKVRDHLGQLNWIQQKDLSAQRFGIVHRGSVDIKAAPNAAAEVLATLEKSVLVAITAPASKGWVKVKHASGIEGYMPAITLWGI